MVEIEIKFTKEEVEDFITSVFDSLSDNFKVVSYKFVKGELKAKVKEDR